MTSIHEIPVPTLNGGSSTLDDYRGQVLLVVNVASKCGYTPQYAGLQQLHERYAGQGFSVLGFPCNQFLFQEPGGADSITACGTSYGVTFPVFGKLKVNGRQRHPLYSLLTATPDTSGKAGRVRWNFEKVLVGRDGTPRARFRTKIAPDDPGVVEAVEKALAE
ncbi:MAG TPA: glutathione peroxidase [Mycobacteriales bacterium]|nr:glutathione peroxidase [Mycobacteriales bacterium]